MFKHALRAVLPPLALLVLSLGIAAGSVACGDDDDGGVEVIGETPGAEPDPEADPDPEPDPEADPDPEPDPVAQLTPGVKPDDATQVDVTLTEFELVVSQPSVSAGKIYFLVENEGPEDPHEFVVIKSDLDAGSLPVEDGVVPEDEVELIDEIEPFAVGSTGSITLDLEPGSYVLICNIAEEHDGELESHYQLGMRTGFTVE